MASQPSITVPVVVEGETKKQRSETLPRCVLDTGAEDEAAG